MQKMKKIVFLFCMSLMILSCGEYNEVLNKGTIEQQYKLASDLYEVETKVLNQAIKRNRGRFPDDFMFRISNQEKEELVTNCDRFKNLKHSSVNPLAFTEHGVAMLSSILKSKKAIACLYHYGTEYHLHFQVLKHLSPSVLTRMYPSS